MPLKQSVMLPAVAAKVEDKVGFIEKAASIGVDAIELLFVDDEFEALCDAAAQHGLKVASMGGHQSLGDGLNNPANHDRIEDELKTSIDLASSLRIPSMICFGGNRIPGMSEDEAVINTAAGLRRAAPYAEAKGVTLNLELLNSRVDHPGYQCCLLYTSPSPRD